MVMSEPYDSTQIFTVSHLYLHQTKPEGQGTKSSVNFWKDSIAGIITVGKPNQDLWSGQHTYEDWNNRGWIPSNAIFPFGGASSQNHQKNE